MLISVKKEVKGKKCPFCNADERILSVSRKGFDIGYSKIECLGCGMSGPDAKNEAEAVMLWNNRIILKDRG